MQVTVMFEDGFKDKGDVDRASEIAKRIAIAADDGYQRAASAHRLRERAAVHQVEIAQKEADELRVVRTMAECRELGERIKERLTLIRERLVGPSAAFEDQMRLIDPNEVRR
jgi:hypothetical protein